MATKTNSKIKPVHFNLNNPDDLKLFNKANKIDNFSKWVKDHLSNNPIQPSELNKDEIRDIVKEILNEDKPIEVVQEYKNTKMDNIIQQEERKECKTPPIKNINELDSMML